MAEGDRGAGGRGNGTLDRVALSQVSPSGAAHTSLPRGVAAPCRPAVGLEGRTEEGWGLVEVTFAVFILLLVTSAIASLLYGLVTASSNTNNKEVAQNIAMSVLQQDRDAAV